MGAIDKKLALRQLSIEARDLREKLIKEAKTDAKALYYSGLRVNDVILKYFYTDAENTEFHTYKGWQELGHQVKKGSKTFVIWGRKRQNVDDETSKSDDIDKYKFYPLAFLFSNMQVEPINKEERH